MSEQEIRDALEGAVPPPPSTPGRGPAARTRARRGRRRRWATAGAVVVAAAVVVPVVRAVSTHHDAGPDLTGAVLGTGRSACHDLGEHHRALGHVVDTRAVDGKTATAWLRAIKAPADLSTVAPSRPVDVCLFYDQHHDYTVVAGAPGGSPVTVSHGAFSPGTGPLGAMQTLDQVNLGGRLTTDAPFRCPSRSTPVEGSVSHALPSGSTGALLCYDVSNLYSPRRILSLDYSDRLVTLVNASPIDYHAPNVTCGGNPFFRPYSIVFRYPSGTRTVSMEECRGLALGPFTRDASTDLDLRFERLLLVDGGLSGEPLSCPAPLDDRPAGVGDLRHVVAAHYCASGHTGPGRALTPGQLSALQAWGSHLMPGGTTSIEGRCTRPAAGWPHLALADAWGNRFTMTIECQHRLYPVVLEPGGGHGVTYPISGDAPRFTHLLRRLAAGS